VSGEQHRKGTRSPAGARAAGGDCVASDAAGGDQGDRELAKEQVEDARAEEGRVGSSAAGRGARARAAAAGGGGGGGGGGGSEAGEGGGGGSGAGRGRGGGRVAAGFSGRRRGDGTARPGCGEVEADLGSGEESHSAAK